MKSVGMDTVMCISNIYVKIKNAHILNDVSFTACSGDLLAVMGPSGSGKTTVLKTIAGRQPICSGEITLSGFKFNKQLRRRLGFVMQEDVFFSNLTLWDTLYFAAMIRLPETVTKEEKLSRLNEIIDVLDIRKCLYTVIGDMFTRGLSGGEKKRASIGCELLTDPDILLLDEPTSGLDSSTAFSMMSRIKEYAAKFNKTVIVTIHQPSSQIYHMFDSLLLLANGQIAYFGGAHSDAVNHFANLGHSCGINFNPADFFLEILKSEKQTVDETVAAYKQKNKLKHTENGHESSFQANQLNGFGDISRVKDKAAYQEVPPFNSTDSLVTFDAFQPGAINSSARQKWPTSFTTQFKMLTWRSFKQSRGRILHIYDVIHFSIMTGVVGSLFFQIPNTADVFRDRMGLLFFCLTFWTFDPTYSAILAFPGERGVISKERAAGAYRLSAYYLAKSTSELPLVLIMPTLFYIVVYWMAGLSDVYVFFSTWAILMLSVISAQGLGLLIGATFMNTKVALLAGNTIILGSVLFSGFMTQTFPWWLTWAKYLSHIQYPLSAMSIIVLKSTERLPCNSTSVTIFPKCLQNDTDYVTSVDMLQKAGIELPVYCYISTLAIICVFLRVTAYFSLRWSGSVRR